jgi:hypothetical protein
MNSRSTMKKRAQSAESKKMTFAAAQKKTGETTKSEIIKVLSEKFTNVRYTGKTKTFYYN